MSGSPSHRASDGPDDDHRRPPGDSDASVAAVGKLTEALETVERARGRLYDFHQLTGSADLQAGAAAETLRAAGHTELAERVETELVGRNVLPGRWTFQVLEEYEAGYYAAVREIERAARDELLGGRRHVVEAELKEDRRTHGRPGHEAQPPHS
jgi:hypothetical protein